MTKQPGDCQPVRIRGCPPNIEGAPSQGTMDINSLIIESNRLVLDIRRRLDYLSRSRDESAVARGTVCTLRTAASKSLPIAGRAEGIVRSCGRVGGAGYLFWGMVSFVDWPT